MFDTSHGRYFICNVNMNSNLSSHDFLPTFNWNQYKMLMSAKGPPYLQVLSCYCIDVRLKLLCSKFALNRTNMKKIKKENFNVHLLATYLTSEKASLCMIKFPNSLKCVNEAHEAESINNNYHIFENVWIKYSFLFSLEIIFIGVVLMLNL